MPIHYSNFFFTPIFFTFANKHLSVFGHKDIISFVGIDKSRLRERRRTPATIGPVKCSTETANSWVWRGYWLGTKRRTFPPFRPYSEPSCTALTLRTNLRVVRTKRTCRWPSIRCRWKRRSRHRHRPFLWFRLYPYWFLFIGLLGSGDRGSLPVGICLFCYFWRKKGGDALVGVTWC